MYNEHGSRAMPALA